MPAKTERQKLLARVHLGAKQKGLSDEEYRSLVGSYGEGKTSSARELKLGALRNLARYLAPTRSERSVVLVDRASYKQQALIRHLWEAKSQRGSERSLNAWLEHHWKVCEAEQLSKRDASKVIAVLQRW